MTPTPIDPSAELANDLLVMRTYAKFVCNQNPNQPVYTEFDVLSLLKKWAGIIPKWVEEAKLQDEDLAKLKEQYPFTPGQLITQGMAEANLSRSQLADKLGIDEDRLTAIISGQESVIAPMAILLSTLLPVDCNTLINSQYLYRDKSNHKSAISLGAGVDQFKN